MANGSIQSWRYEFKKSDPASAKTAYDKLLQDEEDPLTLIDIEDEYSCEVNGFVVHHNGNEDVISCSGEIRIDYKNSLVKLPDDLKNVYQLQSSEVLTKNVRYVELPRIGSNTEENSGLIARLSLWNEARDILNIVISHSGTKQCVLFLNAMSRLIYESFGRDAARTHKFYSRCEGPVDVAWCSADERDARDVLKQRKEADELKSTGDKSTLKKDTTDESDERQKQQEYPELKLSPMYFTIDEEAILLFQHSSSPSPLHDFRFYREKTKKSIDTIHVCNTEKQLEIQQGDNVFLIRPRRDCERSSKCYEELVTILREGTVKAKSKKAFTEAGGAFSKIISDRSPPSATSSSVAYCENVLWLRNLNTGKHLPFANEDMQIMWFSIQSDVEQLVDAGAIPESYMQSAGLNPNSLEHLQTAVESIRDKLLSESYCEAVSLLRGILNVFGETLLATAVADRVSEMELLMRIYLLN